MNTPSAVSAGLIHIVGAGGLGRETLDALFASGRKPDDLVLVDDHLRDAELHGVRVLRPDVVTWGQYVVAVGDPAVRHTLGERMQQRGLTATSVVHPRATLAHDVVIGSGCIVLANAFVSTGTRLGPHSQVQYNATVGHDTALQEYVTVLPGANIAGNVSLQRDVTVGSNACVLPGLVVGAGTFVGAGAVVTKNQPADRVLVGIPARPTTTR
ncbi:NeuD/PglB/VioB family sugar acetyltransferase [Saccharopolyspora mangrovi]|uniref:NeuD/PglB/VioB family sugar acetyltransferase n=1 Tax=Saccharopolyspora mangrovi TaxID=3082379 RepID=A0ABU6A4F1_9PSEU|nr:NeuD/PglB/VioB family sugar acetyltransferase [Saccharopolyspora sp. S2-29]MEB3366459.1 NeuD/PglB/VioB family sugar acetyltransferase [Saccharopolyspora sp. S2-29]